MGSFSFLIRNGYFSYICCGGITICGSIWGIRKKYVLPITNHALYFVGNLDVGLLGAVLELFGHQI